jgi:hypothetical protein
VRPAAALALVVLLVTGCSQAAGVATTPTPAAVTSTTTAPIPSPSDLPLSRLDFTCRLPIIEEIRGGVGVSYMGGFVNFPAVTFTPAADSVIHSRNAVGDFTTDATPTLFGLPQLGHPTFDLAQRRWLPAASSQTTPDGAFYAYATIGPSTDVPATIHLVDVGRGVEKLFEFPVPSIGAPADIEVADIDSAGVYLVEGQFEQYPAGVWMLDPASGASRPLAQVTGVMAVRKGYAWVGRDDPRDPTPPSVPASVRLYDSIARVDLATGAETTWFYRPGAAVTLQGFDAQGAPVVEVVSSPFLHGGSAETRIVATPGTPGSLVLPGGLGLSAPQADGDRLWFGGTGGIYLYTPQAGLRKVFDHGPQFSLIMPAGTCR